LQATIDLKNNCLNMYDQSVRFLAEHELPEKARWETSGETPPDEEEGLLGGPAKPAAPSASAPATANQPAPAARPAAQSAPAASDGTNPEHVSTLMSLGATREEAIRALQ
jgi:DNA damage-inducible protein 1